MLVCAASNYPEVPQASSVEWFDTIKMAHVKTHSLGPQRGSLTWLDWHDGSWWAAYANYDNKGGEPGRDHKLTTLVRYSPDFAEQGAWLFPPAVLERFAPFSSSGGAWGPDGLLYVTGHDRPELYAVKLPEAGPTLDYVATIAITTNGQAIAWEKGGARRTIWSISRTGSEVVAATVPEVARYFSRSRRCASTAQSTHRSTASIVMRASTARPRASRRRGRILPCRSRAGGSNGSFSTNAARTTSSMPATVRRLRTASII